MKNNNRTEQWINDRISFTKAKIAFTKKQLEFLEKKLNHLQLKLQNGQSSETKPAAGGNHE